MVEGDIALLPSDRSVKYGQERWFTKLPPVLTFELSRFEFNQSLGQPEKIHNKLEFPQIIYMDRYMYKSKELIRSKRERSEVEGGNTSSAAEVRKVCEVRLGPISVPTSRHVEIRY